MEQQISPPLQEPQPAPLSWTDAFDNEGWTGEVKTEDFYRRGLRIGLGPLAGFVVYVGLVSNRTPLLLAILGLAAAMLVYAWYAVVFRRLRFRITKTTVTIAMTPPWWPLRWKLDTAELRGFELVERKVWIATGTKNTVETPLWEVIAITSRSAPLHLNLLFKNAHQADAVTARLNYVLARVRSSK